MKRILFIFMISYFANCCTMLDLFLNIFEKKKDKTCYLESVPLTGPGDDIALYCRINDLKEHYSVKRSEYSLYKNILYRNYIQKRVIFGIPVTQTFFDFSKVAKPDESVRDFAINRNAIVAVTTRISRKMPAAVIGPSHMFYEVNFLVFDMYNEFNCERIPVFTDKANSPDVYTILGIALSSDAKHIVSLEKLSEMKNYCSENALIKENKIVFRSENNGWGVVKEIPVPAETTCNMLEFIEEQGIVGMLKDNGAVKPIPIPKEVKLPKPEPALYHYLAQRGIGFKKKLLKEGRDNAS